MNSTCYRIVFNKHRGQLMAVAETASSCTKGATGESSPIQTSTRTASAQPNFTFRTLSLFLWGAFVFGGNAVAQVVADPNAPANQRPTILKDAQGRPLVNIQTPSAAGLSRNTYTQFDVPTGGVVLNNSTSNPWMSNGVFAKTILNEVNSTSASQIKGAVMLNGAAAQVIFANPNGINVDGGSFINATRVTLATGKANVSNGAVTGFNIAGGQINIGAGGLNNSKTPYTDLISRTLALTGKLQAADLSVTTGLQTVDYATGLISNQNTTPNTSGTFAIDTAALGGMYANNISLLSTEAGLGVRNQGTWQASAGQLVVTADGQLRNAGTIQAKVASLATVSGDITNSGKLLGDQALVVSAGGNLNVQGTGLVQNTGSTLILNANKNINVQKTTDYGVAKILSTEAGGQLSMSAGQAVVVDADSTVAAHRSVQISSDGTLSLNKASVIATEGEVSVMAAKDMAVTNSQVTGQNVHLETGVAFDDKTLGNIQITGGNIRGSTQTTVIASGNLKVTGNGGTPVSGAGNVYLNAEKTLEVSANTTLDATQHMSLTAGTDVVLYGNNTQHVTATAGGNLLVAGNGVELQASKLKAGNNLELQAYNGPLKQFAMKDTAGSTADRVTLNATNSLNVSTYNGKTYLNGVQATAKDINIVGNGQTQLIGVALKQGSNNTWLGNQLTATDSLSIANLNDTAGVTSQLEINTSELKAAGLARVIGNGPLLLGSQVNTISGKNSPAAVSITAGSIGVQAKQVSTYASQLTTNGDKSTASKNGNIDLIATDSTLLLNDYQGVTTQLNATGDIRLHAKGDMTASNLKAKGTGNLLGTSATGKITATGSQLEARDQLSLASQGAQSHTNGVYKGGVTSLYNKTGTMNLVNVQASGLGTTTASLSKLGAQVSVESGGSISMDAASTLEGQTAVTFIQGQGDITLNPSSVAQGTVRWSQVDSNGTTSLVARNGNINLTGIAGTTGAGTSSTVNISALGNLNLVGNNVNLQASSLFVDGVLNIDATQGNFIASALRETKDGNTMAWKGSYVRGAKGLNIHAAKTIGLDSFIGNSTAGSINLASDGVLNSQNSTVIASDLLSVNSAEAQSHNNTTLQGGASSVYNKTGAMTLINARVNALETSTASLASISGKASLESGGTLSMDAGSSVYGRKSSSLILGQGDIVIDANMRSTEKTVGALDWSQVVSTNMSLVARNGNILMKGRESTAGLNTAAYVGRAVSGDLNLVGNNVTLEGSALRADGNLNITALQGNVQVSSLEESVTENGRVNTYWQNAVLEGNQGVNVRATGNIDIKGTNLRSSNGMVNVQAAGSLTMSGDYAHLTRETDGWLDESIYIRNIMDISGKQGVSLGALGGNLRLSAQTINAPEGGIQLQALGDISLESAQEYFRSQRSTTKSYSALFGTIKGRVTINEWSDNLKNNPVKLNGKDILVKAGNNLNTYGSQFNATGNLSLQAGDNINYYGVYDQQSSGREATGSGRFLFAKTGDQVRDTRQQYTGQPTVLQSQQDILSQSGGDQLLQGTKVVYGGTATFQAGVGEKARADARVILEGLKNSTTQMHTEKSNSVVWQSMVDRGSVTETLALPTFSGPSTPVFKAPGGLSIQIPDGNLKAEIAKLQNQPGMEYIQTLAARSDINWQPVKLAHEQWDYKQSGLTPAGAALVAVLVAWAMPAAAGTLGGTLSGASATAAGAAMSSLATQATITLINNKGDVGKTLKDMGSSQVVKSTIAAALTAGALETLGGAELMKGLNASNSTLSQQVTYNLINSTTRSLINASITGEDLTNALKVGLITGLVDTAHGQVASKIKLLQDDYIIHKLAHALAGCAAGAAAGGTCKDGAIGAAVGEMTAELFAGQKPGSTATVDEIKAYNKKVTGYSQLAAGAVTALAGGNAQTAINTAGVAVQNNYLSKPQLQALQAELNTCKQNNCTESQTDAILKKYVTLSAQNDAALAACTTTACVDQHSKALQEASAYSAEVMWQVGNVKGNQSLISELQGRQNKATSLIYAYGKANTITQARKEMDLFVQNNCKGLSQQACTTRLQSSQETNKIVVEILAGFTPAGIAIDFKDLLEAKTMSDYSLAVLGTILPGLGDGIKAILKAEKAAVNVAQEAKRIESAAQVLNHQQARNAELLALFDKTNPANSIKLGGESYEVVSESTAGTAKLLNTAKVSDATLEKQVREYVSELTGGAQLIAVEGRPGFFFARVGDGSTVNLRNDSTSKVGRWTVDIVRNAEIKKLGFSRDKIEVKFK